MRSTSRCQRRTTNRLTIGVMTHALGALALLVTILGLASWQRASHLMALSTGVTPGAGARHQNELRVDRAASDENAHFLSRAPLLGEAVCASAHIAHERIQAPDGVTVPTRDNALGRTAILLDHTRRSWTARVETAPESARHRAANPARGPPV